MDKGQHNYWIYTRVAHGLVQTSAGAQPKWQSLREAAIHQVPCVCAERERIYKGKTGRTPEKGD